MLGGKMATKSFIKPEQIGGMVLFLCGEHATGITGAAYTIDGGWTTRTAAKKPSTSRFKAAARRRRSWACLIACSRKRI